MAGGSLLEQMLEAAAKNGSLRNGGGAGQDGGLGDILGQVLGGGQPGGAGRAQPGGGGLGDILGQVLGGGQPGAGRAQPGGGGLGDILGQVLGGGQAGGSAGRAQPGGGGLGDILGQVLGGGAAGGGLGDIFGQVLGGGQASGGRPTGGSGGGTLGDVFRQKDIRVGSGTGRSSADEDIEVTPRRTESPRAPTREPTVPQSSGKGGIEIPANLKRYGGLAILGVLAWKVLQSYQSKTGAPAGEASTKGFDPNNAPGGAEGLQNTLVNAMIAATQADGVVDQTEQQQLLGELDKLGVDATERQNLAKRLATAVDVASVVKAATTPEIAVQIYAASALAIAVDTPQERQYLDGLAQSLKLPPALKAQVEQTLGKA